MALTFYKYQGAGNDFIIIDNRNLEFSKEDVKLINQLCDRRFGIGADGLMLLENEEAYDFRMVYYNADGRESSMCGNGGRCIIAFAKQIGVIKKEATFIAIDGPHYAEVLKDGSVALGMIDVNNIEKIAETDYFLDTGSPHFVRILDEFPLNFVSEAKKIRYNDRFKKDGVNVNFILISGENIQIRTYERGVEDETLACGTGAVAAAITSNQVNGLLKFNLKTKGGNLNVHFNLDFKQIVLEGPAEFVYMGVL